VGPVLWDGTTIRDLINLERREVSLRVLNDPEIHRLELKRIFTRSWMPVGHVNEIPNAGDYMLRTIGEEPVIVTRDADGEIHALLNVCAHRGVEVCRTDVGNTDVFQCPYHGWAYDSAGHLVGAPFEQKMYGGWDKSGYGLQTAKVELRHGVIFANFDLHAAPLDEWFGDFGWYFDKMFDYDEWEPLGPLQRFVINGNWKVQADQLVGDVYHVATAHKALVETGFIPDVMGQLDTIKITFPEGHGIVSLNPPEGMGSAPTEGAPTEGDSSSGRTFISLLYPGRRVSGGRAGMNIPGIECSSASIGGFDPIGPGKFDSWSLWLVSKGTPAASKATLVKMLSVSQALVEPDDSTCWASMTRAAGRGVLAGERTMKYNARTEEGPRTPDGWPGPGAIYEGFPKDDTHWHFWERWFEMMTADER